MKLRIATLLLALLTAIGLFTGCARWKEKNAKAEEEKKQEQEKAEAKEVYNLLLDAYKKTKDAASLQYEHTYTNVFGGSSSIQERDTEGNITGSFSVEEDSGKLFGEITQRLTDNLQDYSYTANYFYADDTEYYVVPEISDDVVKEQRATAYTLESACLKPHVLGTMGLNSFIKLANELSKSEYQKTTEDDFVTISLSGNCEDLLKLLPSDDFFEEFFNPEAATYSKGYCEVTVDPEGFLSGIVMKLDYESDGQHSLVEHYFTFTASENEIEIKFPQWLDNGGIHLSQETLILYPGQDFNIDELLEGTTEGVVGISFESSNPYVAEIDEYGYISAFTDGRATIRVHIEYKSGSETLELKLTVRNNFDGSYYE